MKDGHLTGLLTPLLAQFGLELESLDSVPVGKRRLLRVIVDGDGPQGRGPTLDDIAEATTAISEALDQEDLVGGPAYTLEVSSRGTARPLTEPKHWRRNIGRLVRVTRHDGEELTGRIRSNDDTHATLTVITNPKKQITVERDIALADVAKALIQVEMNRKGTDNTDEEREG